MNRKRRLMSLKQGYPCHSHEQGNYSAQSASFPGKPQLQRRYKVTGSTLASGPRLT